MADRAPLLISIILVILWSPLKGENVAFFYALDQDLAALKGVDSPTSRSLSIGGTSVQGFQIGTQQVWAVKMGVGNIETAMNALNLLSRFPCEIAICIGPAGSLNESLHPGAWFRAIEVIGYQRGSFGENGWTLSPGARKKLSFPSHLESAISQHFSELTVGSVASGDAFISYDAERQRISDISSAQVVDMNSFGLSLACEQTRTPLLLLKLVSDRANHSAGADFKEFTKSYDGVGGRLAKEFILSLPPSPSAPESYNNIRNLLK